MTTFHLQIFDADHASSFGNWYPCGHLATEEECRKLAALMKAKGYALRLVRETTEYEAL